MEILQQFYYKNNRINQLKGFYFTVMNDGSVSDAAKAMHVSPSTITVQIQSLERDLDTKLFNRDKKRLAITSDGERFYQKIAPLLQGVDGAFEEFIREKKQVPSTLDIAAHHIAVSYLLPPFIKRFHDHYPDIHINIRNISRDDALKRLKQGEIDMMLYPTTDVPIECIFKPSFSYDPILLMRNDHPLAQKDEILLTDITDYPLVRIEKGLVTLPLFENMIKTYGWGSNITFELGNWEILKHFVRANIGIAVVNTICLDADDPMLIGKPLTRYFPQMTYGMMLKKGRHIHQSLKNFINIVDPSFLDNNEHETDSSGSANTTS